MRLEPRLIGDKNSYSIPASAKAETKSFSVLVAMCQEDIRLTDEALIKANICKSEKCTALRTINRDVCQEGGGGVG